MMQGSKIAIAAALTIGLGGLTLAAPASAKKEDKAATGGFNANNLSPAFRAPAADIQKGLDPKTLNLADAEAKIAVAEPLAKNDSDRYILSTFKLQLADQKNRALPPAQQNPAVLVGPLDELLANPITSVEEKKKFSYFRAGIAYQAKQYPQAVQFYTQARTLGYQNPDLALNLAQAKIESGDVAGGMADLDASVKADIAAGKKPPESEYLFAISRLYKAGLNDQVDVWTQNWLSAYGSRENWRKAIYTFGFSGPSAARLTDRNRIDLYRLMRATNSLAGAKEYIDYAEASIKTGLPTEAKATIKEGLDSKVIPAGNPTAADFAKQANELIAGDKPLAVQEKAAVSAPKGDLASQAGDAYLGERNFAKAAEMYKLAATKGVADNDRLNLHLGIALALGGDKDGAKAVLAKVSGTPNTAIAKLWITWIVTPPVA
jgi:tetratricopeptide (TPR) repeat protein